MLRCWLWVALCLSACSRTDVVAHAALRDSGPSKPPDAAPVHDAGPDASPDAGCLDPADCGPPPVPGVCPAQDCPSLASRAAFCAASQPTAALVGDGCAADGRLQFRFAVCTCDGLTTNSRLLVDSLGGAAVPASVAINTDLQLGPDTAIAGSLFVTGRYEAVSMPRLSGQVYLQEPPHCGCALDQLLNVPRLIADRALDNDNALAMLSSDLLNGFDTAQNLSLDCGRYYFDEVNGSEPLTIEARGRVALFIAGDLSVNDNFTLTLASGSSAVIFVEGNMHVGARLQLGANTDANRVLLVVNGTGTVNLRDGSIEGSIYAPRAQVVTRGLLELRGSLFVNRGNLGGETRVRYLPLSAAQTMCGGG